MPEQARPSKPADAFAVGERIRFENGNGTVTSRAYQNDRKQVLLGIDLDDDPKGVRWIFESGEPVEVGDSLPLRRRVKSLLRSLL